VGVLPTKKTPEFSMPLSEREVGERGKFETRAASSIAVEGKFGGGWGRRFLEAQSERKAGERVAVYMGRKKGEREKY